MANKRLIYRLFSVIGDKTIASVQIYTAQPSLGMRAEQVLVIWYLNAAEWGAQTLWQPLCFGLRVVK